MKKILTILSLVVLTGGYLFSQCSDLAYATGNGAYFNLDFTSETEAMAAATSIATVEVPAQAGGTITLAVSYFGAAGANFRVRTDPVQPLNTIGGQSPYTGDVILTLTNGSQVLCTYLNNQLQTEGPLPVELISFKAQLNDRQIDLHWETASELNNEGFKVERGYKVDQHFEWENMGFIEGRGTSSIKNYYEFTDHNPTIGTSYYRLKQIDFDGRFEYSNIISIDYQLENDKLGQLDIYPNPVSMEEVTLRNAEGLVTIFNIMGQPVQSFLLETNEPFRYNVANLPNGQYLLYVQKENGQSSYRNFVRQH